MLRAGVAESGGGAAADRLAPERFEPPWVPEAVRRHAGGPDMLPVGSPGKVGLLELAFERIGERTELTGHYQKAPLHITRPLYHDPARPDLPYVMLMMSGGGVLQGDRYRIDASCGAGASVHLTTQGATRLYRMEQDYATQRVDLTVGPGGYLEYLPDPTIPFGGSRYYQRIAVTADRDATVVLGETLLAGRLARGERHAYTAYCGDVEVRDPDGRLLFADPVRLVPAELPVTGPAVMAGFGVVSSLYVVSGLRPAQEIADALHTALAATGLRAGAGVLPGDVGAWARVLGDRSPEVLAASTAMWDAVRRLLLGVPAPDPRKQ
ncbi:urease accessory protein UreD [Actinocorallia sp. A-T 12471]|uniref:urease accessory protein UreD n=1 Tax=Actinocorallia sp. A-T 12471 TaxID=3089813 RepID=UPI0029D0224C|nr:urease accessory protein UreD [Actinocorallia sp. A-T 12471]MDX6740430.1 urease accessory protein UreD [Actinocorallia sp. A-T 12471]